MFLALIYFNLNVNAIDIFFRRFCLLSKVPPIDMTSNGTVIAFSIGINADICAPFHSIRQTNYYAGAVHRNRADMFQSTKMTLVQLGDNQTTNGCTFSTIVAIETRR